jgi:hypothetical protein
MDNLSTAEKKLFKKLNTPGKIQDFLDTLKINFEKQGDTCSSPRIVLKRKTAHCIEAAIFAAAVMIFNNQKPLLLDLKANSKDFDHVVCLFKKNGLWGAISKSNHAALRYREPIYKSIRELAMSFFHEYLTPKGEKTLRKYSRPFSLSKYGTNWFTVDYDLWQIANELDQIKHYNMIPAGLKLRRASKLETQVGKITEW